MSDVQRQGRIGQSSRTVAESSRRIYASKLPVAPDRQSRLQLSASTQRNQSGSGSRFYSTRSRWREATPRRG